MKNMKKSTFAFWALSILSASLPVTSSADCNWGDDNLGDKLNNRDGLNWECVLEDFQICVDVSPRSGLLGISGYKLSPEGAGICSVYNQVLNEENKTSKGCEQVIRKFNPITQRKARAWAAATCQCIFGNSKNISGSKDLQEFYSKCRDNSKITLLRPVNGEASTDCPTRDDLASSIKEKTSKIRELAQAARTKIREKLSSSRGKNFRVGERSEDYFANGSSLNPLHLEQPNASGGIEEAYAKGVAKNPGYDFFGPDRIKKVENLTGTEWTFDDSRLSEKEPIHKVEVKYFDSETEREMKLDCKSILRNQRGRFACLTKEGKESPIPEYFGYRIVSDEGALKAQLEAKLRSRQDEIANHSKNRAALGNLEKLHGSRTSDSVEKALAQARNAEERTKRLNSETVKELSERELQRMIDVMNKPYELKHRANLDKNREIQRGNTRPEDSFEERTKKVKESAQKLLAVYQEEEEEIQKQWEEEVFRSPGHRLLRQELHRKEFERKSKEINDFFNSKYKDYKTQFGENERWKKAVDFTLNRAKEAKEERDPYSMPTSAGIVESRKNFDALMEVQDNNDRKNIGYCLRVATVFSRENDQLTPYLYCLEPDGNVKRMGPTLYRYRHFDIRDY